MCVSICNICTQYFYLYFNVLLYIYKHIKIFLYIATPTQPKSICKPVTCISLEKGRVP